MDEKRKRELQAKVHDAAWLDQAIDRLGEQFADAVDAQGGTVFANSTPPPEEYISDENKKKKKKKKESGSLNRLRLK